MSSKNQTQAYGIFWRRSLGVPNAAKLLDDRLYWDLEEACHTWDDIDDWRDLEVRSVMVSVGDVVECDHGTFM
jgi:hypothetical protein